MVNVLVIGSGGREHALCWALKKSEDVDKVFCLPGNGGISEIATCIKGAFSNHEKVIAICDEHEIEFVVVGPEAPMVDGLVDALNKAGIATFGASKKAARLEGSKAYMKKIAKKAKIPTAAYEHFTNLKKAHKYIDKHFNGCLVIKADGLAAGKGVIIANSIEEAKEAAKEMLEAGKFGDAGKSIVIEEFLEGEEISFFALMDGTSALPLVSVQDHKRVGDGDTGLNTGGMGTYSPAPVMNDKLHEEVMQTIINPLLDTMQNEGAPYTGVIFAGLMVKDNKPYLLEFNVRFGDPETQVIMNRLESDIYPALRATTDGSLGDISLKWRDEVSLCVVMAANGYPGSYDKGTHIKGVTNAGKLPNTTIYHAGTTKEEEEFYASGGRVLGVTARGNTVENAQKNAYYAVDAIDWPQGFCRRDIGYRAIEREKLDNQKAS